MVTLQWQGHPDKRVPMSIAGAILAGPQQVASTSAHLQGSEGETSSHLWTPSKGWPQVAASWTEGLTKPEDISNTHTPQHLYNLPSRVLMCLKTYNWMAQEELMLLRNSVVCGPDRPWGTAYRQDSDQMHQLSDSDQLWGSEEKRQPHSMRKARAEPISKLAITGVWTGGIGPSTFNTEGEKRKPRVEKEERMGGDTVCLGSSPSEKSLADPDPRWGFKKPG